MAHTENEILEGLAEIVNEETGLEADAVQPDKSFTEDLDIDSLSMMTIVVNAEEKFDVRIPDEEVKNLATQTGKATEEIAAQIAHIQATTGEAVGAIRSITATIAQVSEITLAVAGAVGRQSAATAEIARNVDQASSGTHEVCEGISGVTEAARETGRTAGQMLDAALDLSRQSETLRGRVDVFIGEVRSA